MAMVGPQGPWYNKLINTRRTTMNPISRRIQILETRLNAMTRQCPLRIKVQIREEIRQLRSQLEG